MGKKFLTFIYVILLSIWCGLWKLAQYKIDMAYSGVAASQVDDDNSYSLLRVQSTVETITNVIGWVGIFILVYLVYRLWFRRPKDSTQ